MAKIKVMDIELSDWFQIEKHIGFSYENCRPGFYRITKNFKGSIIYDIDQVKRYYLLSFVGDCKFLQPIYYSIYPQIKINNHYKDSIIFNRIDEAQEHMDKFLIKINNLKSFM